MSGLKSERAVYFSADLLCLLHPLLISHNSGETAFTTTTPLCFGFFWCCIDVLQSLFSSDTISFAEFNVSLIGSTFCGMFVCSPLVVDV